MYIHIVDAVPLALGYYTYKASKTKAKEEEVHKMKELTQRQKIASQVLDYVPRDYHIELDMPAIVDAIQDAGASGIDDMDVDALDEIIEAHQLESTAIDQSEGGLYVRAATLYSVKWPYTDDTISVRYTLGHGGESFWEVQSDLEGPQAQSFAEADDYEWVDADMMICEAMRFA